MNDPIYGNNPNNNEGQAGQAAQVVAPAQVTNSQGNGSLHWLQEEEVRDLQNSWMNIQSKFVDEPRKAVEEADALVADAMDRIEKGFDSKRKLLDQHWTNNSDVSTEDLRTILQDYRAFFNRLLSL